MLVGIVEEPVSKEVESFTSLEDMVSKIGGDYMSTKLITKTALIFEFIDEDGRLKYSMIHPSSVSRTEGAELVVALFSQVMENMSGDINDIFGDEDYDVDSED